VLSSASATATNALTVEYWLYIGDRMQDEHTTFFYSVYDSSQVPTYDQSNELSQHFSKALDGVRNIRGTVGSRVGSPHLPPCLRFFLFSPLKRRTERKKTSCEGRKKKSTIQSTARGCVTISTHGHHV
jgi:hypothetical protein